ncbi:hypothetical protein JKF63_07849 [Porcisia hertigi]|uniref:Uncharacterized protein n=1 Tax=Porcisia hertigi TaxID=2761500 RepID=A0A836YHX6_9TRYP|nr:hypothetical protein JKF63_07849 [Porcisia hertigi]
MNPSSSREIRATALALQTCALRYAPSTTVVLAALRFWNYTALLQPKGLRCYATSTATSTAAATRPMQTSAATPSQTQHTRGQRHHVIHLGNELSAEVPVSGCSSTPYSLREHSGSHTRRKAIRRHRHGEHAPAFTGDGNTRTDAANGEAHAQSQQQSKHPRQATSSLLLTPQERDAENALEIKVHGPLHIPHSTAETVALLKCTTVLEALDVASPQNVTRWCPPASDTKTAAPAPGDVRVNFEELQTRALPLLLDFPQGAATEADLARALQCLEAHLQYMAAATRTDGRRHVSALPPAVVVVLWEKVMPHVHRCAHNREAPRPSPQPNLAARDEDAHEGVGRAETLGASDAEDAATELLDAAHAPVSSSTASATLPIPTPSIKKSVYVPLRRALALYTRRVATLLPPPALALVLTRMHQCGALADDVLGPIVTDLLEALRRRLPHPFTNGGSSTAVLQQRVLRLLPNGVGSGDDRDAASPVALFTGAAAVTMARLLGRAAIPGHHQLHRFFHIVLLPEVTRVLKGAAQLSAEAAGEAIEALSPGVDALLDLTAALSHYAVSGHAVTHLTTLWTMHLAHRQRTGDAAAVLAVCTALLQAVSSVPFMSNRTQRRQARNIRGDISDGGGDTMQRQRQRRLLRVTEGDYYPLVDEVCAQVCRSCHLLQNPASTHNTATVVTPTQLLALLRMLLRVNSPHWAETYETVASAALAALANAAASVAPAAATTPERHEDEEVEHLLPLSDTRRTIHALLHRGSLIPDHPLHYVLLRRLLHSPAAMADPAVASQVLLGLELMMPVEQRSAYADEGTAIPAAPVAGDGSSHTASNGRATTTTCISASAGTTVVAVPMTTGMAVETLTSTLALTPSDRNRALQVFRRIGRSITPTAFIAGLCVVPLDRLPPTAQIAVVNHLTSVASTVAPSYLVKGVEAVVRQLPSCAIDDVSVQHWFSRFTARDVVQRVDPVGCATLLNVLSANPRYQRNCALATACITRRIGAALRWVGEDGSAASSLSLDSLPHVVASLQRANVFLPQYYSRVCRQLLGQVEQAPLGETLRPFEVLAEAYMSRQRSEAQASVFKDVWELLRGRVMEEARQLTLEETVTAINAFAALDVTDRALFGVLIHQLWMCLRTAEAMISSAASNTESTEVAPPVLVVCPERHAQQPSDNDDAAKAQVRRRVHAAQHVLRTLTPSAVAVVTTTLFARSDARELYVARAHAAAGIEPGKGRDTDGDLVCTLLPWMLITLRACHAELYPVDVVHLMQSLSEHYAAAVEQAGAGADGVDQHIAVLHAAYDACRNTFLLMYALLPDADATAAAQEEPLLLSVAECKRIAEQRAEWTPATRTSVEVVPRPWFASLLVSLSSAALVDLPVALACVRRACTRRVCGELLPISQLVDVCLSLCWLITTASPTTTATTTGDVSTCASNSSSSNDDGDDDDDDAQAHATLPTSPPGDTSPPSAPGALLRTAMGRVLSALWQRSDELTTAQINALLRCLRDTYGADKVDADFVGRLEAQKKLLSKQGAAAAAAAAICRTGDATATDSTSAVASDVTPPEHLQQQQQQQQPNPKPLAQIDAEDLFSTV